jgi:hypothetical protein
MRDESSDKPVEPRRGLLKALGLATGAALAPPSADAFEANGGTTGLPPRKEGEEEKRKARYRETPHVQAFYRTNGF